MADKYMAAAIEEAEFLRSRDVKVEVTDDAYCFSLMQKFITDFRGAITVI